MIRHSRLPLLILSAAALVVVAGANDPLAPAGTPALQTVPHPDAARFEPGLREKIAAAKKRLGVDDPRQRAGAYGRLGMLYHAHELYAPALAAYQNAARLNDADFRWPYLLASLRHEAGDLDGAAESYTRALTLRADYLPARIHLGQARLARNELQAAQAAFERVLKKRPDDAASLAGLGAVALQRKDYAAAIRHFERALQREPEATQLHYPLALAYRHQKDNDAARRHLALKGPRKPAVADPLLGQVSALRGTSQDHIKQGLKAHGRQDYAAAAAAYRAALAANPDDARTHLALAWVLELSKKPAASLRHVNRALALSADYPKAHYAKGALLEQQGRDDEAIEHYELAVAGAPDELPPRVLLANVLMRRGRFEAAAKHYAWISARTPDDALILYRLALARLGAGVCHEAREPLQRAFERMRGDATLLQAMVRGVSSCAASAAPDRQAALGYGQRLFEKIPRWDTGAALAMALAANGRFEDAERLQARAITESEKAGASAVSVKELKTNLTRYRKKQPAARAWATAEPVFDTPRITPQARLSLELEPGPAPAVPTSPNN